MRSQMVGTNWKKQVTAAFKLRGLFLAKDALSQLTLALEHPDMLEPQAELDKLLHKLRQRDLTSTLVTLADLSALIKLNAEEAEGGGGVGGLENNLRVVSAFGTPAFHYDMVRRSFVHEETKTSLLDSPALRSAAFKERFQILRQRTLRNKSFDPKAAAAAGQEHFPLTDLQCLRTLPDRRHYVLGMLTQPVVGKFQLEDCYDSIPVDISGASSTVGLFTENSFVLAEGSMQGSTFVVDVLAFPPAEPREETEQNFPNLSAVREGEMMSALHYDKILDAEKAATEVQFVILSDLWLDRPKTLDRLDLLFSQFAEISRTAELCDQPYFVFVLMGNFLSTPDHSSLLKYTAGFNALALILEQERMKPLLSSGFIIMPGPQDPTPARMLPSGALPPMVTRKFKDLVPHAQCTSNPARVRFYTQEIVLFRENMQQKMRMHSRKPAEEDAKLQEQLLWTLFDQAHLSPLPIPVSPICWSHDHALRLYPLPNLLVLGDDQEAWNVEYMQSKAANPGSFGENGNFVVYVPAFRSLEPSMVDL